MLVKNTEKTLTVEFSTERLEAKHKAHLKALIEKDGIQAATDYLATFAGRRRWLSIERPDATVSDKDAKCRQTGGFWLAKHLAGFKYFGSDLKPDSIIPDGEAIGVEIECLIPREYSDGSSCGFCEDGEEHDECQSDSESRDEAESRIENLFKRMGVKNVRIKDDGSLRTDDNEHSFEFICLFNRKNPAPLENLCKALAKLNARVNKSCGLHVHLDARDGDARAMARRLKNALPLLKKMVPKSRLENQYCQRDMSSRGHRYAKINTESLRKHQTIEVRMHTGTTNFDKIHNWVRVLLAIARGDYRMSAATAANTLTALSRIGMTDDLNAWVMARIQLFTGPAFEIANGEERAA